MQKLQSFLLLSSVALFSAAVLSSCSGGGSGATGWAYNDSENGGFQKLPYIGQETGPGLVFVQGGTFTITNGGVFGSMLSTTIINPPQSAILGMHNIVERPVAENGQVVIRPIMYLALSYDHRIIDGRESVSFLVKVKDMLENPERMLFSGKSAEEILLGL